MSDEQTTPYDPADHTVAEVSEYLATLAPADVVAVKAQEAEGKNRVGIADWSPEANDNAGETPPEDPTEDEDGYTRIPVEDPYGTGGRAEG